MTGRAPRLFTIAEPAFDAVVLARIEGFRARHDPQHTLLGPHVTLEFGQTTQPLADYAAAAGQVATRHAAFDIAIAQALPWTDGVGTPYLFLHPGDGAAQLQALHRDLAADLGLPPAVATFTPHITIGRAPGADGAAAALARLPAGIIGAVARIDALVIGALDGGRFSVLQRLPLRRAQETPCSTT